MWRAKEPFEKALGRKICPADSAATCRRQRRRQRRWVESHRWSGESRLESPADVGHLRHAMIEPQSAFQSEPTTLATDKITT
jgi:hypothetical protein